MQLLESNLLCETKPTKKCRVEFKFHAPDARKVSLAGNFTKWIASARPLKQNAHGTWTTVVLLKPGRYGYKFLVDDGWQNDPSSAYSEDDGFGGVNNVIDVKE